MQNIELQSLLQRSNIESNKQFQRLSEKTQVVVPMNGQQEVVKNRLTHSYEVATSSMIVAAQIAKQLNLTLYDIDYQGAIYSSSLLHDIGHPPFGHDGSGLLNKKFKELGVTDGFTDNNNNLVIIEKNNIVVGDYTLASIIKYPNELYSYQKEQYIPILNKSIEEDYEHFKQFDINLHSQTRTIACQIMDEADTNSYACSDLADFLCLGNGNTVNIKKIHELAKKIKLDYHYSELNTLSNIIKSDSKTAIKAYFNDLKNRFNFNYKLTDKGIEPIDESLIDYRNFLKKVSNEFYIKPIRSAEFHSSNMEKMKTYIDVVINHHYFPSSYYANKIKQSETDIEKYTYMRDMIAEASDWYILKYFGDKDGL